MASGVCHFMRLACVEVQLVLQWLDGRDKIVAARCCHLLLTEAAKPLAWRGAPLLRLDLLKLPLQHPELISSITSPLLRVAPLRLFSSANFDRPALELLQRLQLPPLRSLQAYFALVQQWPSIFRLPCIQELHTLELWYGPAAADTAETVVSISHLRTLRTLSLWAHTNDDPDEAFRALGDPDALPQLTSLSCEAKTWQRSLTPLALFASRLRCLTVNRGWFNSAVINFSCHNLADLIELHLSGYIYNPVDDSARWILPSCPIVESFASLRSLRTLSLSNMPVDVLLDTAVPHLPVLQLLRLFCSAEFEANRVRRRAVPSPNPTLGALVTLLARCPSSSSSLEAVHLVVSVYCRRSTLSSWSAQAPSQSLLSERWRELWSGWKQLPRVSMVET
jgi:hypothetical protein